MKEIFTDVINDINDQIEWLVNNSFFVYVKMMLIIKYLLNYRNLGVKINIDRLLGLTVPVLVTVEK